LTKVFKYGIIKELKMNRCKLCTKEKENLVKNDMLGMICEECDAKVSITGANSEIYLTSSEDVFFPPMGEDSKKA
jgi:hypothetical protein